MPDTTPLTLDAVLAAVETIDRLHSIGDGVYDVLRCAAEGDNPFDGDSWEHPDVIAYGGAVNTLNRAVAEYRARRKDAAATHRAALAAEMGADPVKAAFAYAREHQDRDEHKRRSRRR